MNTVKKITFLILATVLLSQCEINHAEIPEGNVYFPDSNFLQVLIDEGIDTNNDGQISYAEAYEVRSLYFEGDVCLMCEGWCASRLEIESLEGIKAFVNLGRLSFSCTKIEHLNLPNLPKLTALFCMNDTLKSLDISKCTALRKLTIGFNQLTSIDVSNNKDLEDFICHDNQLTTIAITDSQALTFLECSSNQLIEIDVTQNPILVHLSCSDNQLTRLDISRNSALTELYVSDMPSLNKICVWEMPFPPAGVEIYTSGSPNLYYTLDCN